jgi:hypothetical protein
MADGPWPAGALRGGRLVAGVRRRGSGVVVAVRRAHLRGRDEQGACAGRCVRNGHRQPGESGWREAATRPAGLLLLTALVVGLLGQGAYYTRVRWHVGVLVAAATVLHI